MNLYCVFPCTKPFFLQIVFVCGCCGIKKSRMYYHNFASAAMDKWKALNSGAPCPKKVNFDIGSHDNWNHQPLMPLHYWAGRVLGSWFWWWHGIENTQCAFCGSSQSFHAIALFTRFHLWGIWIHLSKHYHYVALLFAVLLVNV